MRTIDVDAIFPLHSKRSADTFSLLANQKKILQDAIRTLSRSRNCVAIFGERGAGKTTLGLALQGLLEGRVPLHALGLRLSRQPSPRKCIRWNASHDSVASFLHHFSDVDGFDSKRIADVLQALTPRARTSSNEAVVNEASIRKMSLYLAKILGAATEQDHEDEQRGLVVIIDDVQYASQQIPFGGFSQFIEWLPVQFVLIGCEVELRDLLGDDSHAERKFAKSQFHLELLTNREVREMFDDASRRAGEQNVELIFTDGFCDLVAEDFCGYPLQTLTFGADVAHFYRERLEAGYEVLVRESDYADLLEKRDTSISRDIRTINALDAGVGASVPRWEALKEIVNIRTGDSKGWVKASQLGGSSSRTALHETLQPLIIHQVLEFKDDTGFVRIANPSMLCEIKRRIRLKWDPRRRS